MDIHNLNDIQETMKAFDVPLEDPLLRSLYFGYNGSLYVGFDEQGNKACILADIGHTFYYYGDAHAKDAEYLINKVEDYAEIHANKDWQDRIKKIYKDKISMHTRYDMDASKLDQNHLKSLANMFEGELIYQEIDQALYTKLKNMSWTSSMVENFKDVDDFEKNGYGIVLLDKSGKILSGTSSFVRYEEGFEIEIATHKDERRKGYALSTAAYFILQVLKRGYTVHWDAANLGSKLLAEKLGFTLKEVYEVLDI